MIFFRRPCWEGQEILEWMMTSHHSSPRSLATPLLKTKAKRARAKDREGLPWDFWCRFPCFRETWSQVYLYPLVFWTKFIGKSFNKVLIFLIVEYFLPPCFWLTYVHWLKGPWANKKNQRTGLHKLEAFAMCLQASCAASTMNMTDEPKHRRTVWQTLQFHEGQQT